MKRRFNKEHATSIVFKYTSVFTYTEQKKETHMFWTVLRFA